MAPQLTGALELKYVKKETYLSMNTSYKSSYYFSDSHDSKSEHTFCQISLLVVILEI